MDTILQSEDNRVHYPTEFLNSLHPPDLEPRKLVLKVVTPIILLRNLNPPKLCNGTRFLIKRQKCLIECTIKTACGNGNFFLIPRITMISAELPY